jgi:hypothetical protein
MHRYSFWLADLAGATLLRYAHFGDFHRKFSSFTHTHTLRPTVSKVHDRNCVPRCLSLQGWQIGVLHSVLSHWRSCKPTLISALTGSDPLRCCWSEKQLCPIPYSLFVSRGSLVFRFAILAGMITAGANASSFLEEEQECCVPPVRPGFLFVVPRTE